MVKICFWDNGLGERGTSVALYDYAHFNETILGNKSIIASYKNAPLTTYDKFKSRFGDVILVDHFSELDKIQCDYVYDQKFGFNDNNISSNAKNLIHCAFESYEPHGDVYAYVSKWLADKTKQTYGLKEDLDYVPYMINLPDVKEDFKEFFNVGDRLVIGWYGGNNFHMPMSQEAVRDVARKRKDILFLFMNSDQFCDEENVIFIGPTTNVEQKVAFINTCDAMIYARERGETFGLAIAEFSTKNKPIICHSFAPERFHIETLGDKGMYYDDYNSLCNILLNIQKLDIEDKEWNCYQAYTPENVINHFNQVYLK
jgi:hypothetical protein